MADSTLSHITLKLLFNTLPKPDIMLHKEFIKCCFTYFPFAGDKLMRVLPNWVWVLEKGTCTVLINERKETIQIFLPCTNESVLFLDHRAVHYSIDCFITFIQPLWECIYKFTTSLAYRMNHGIFLLYNCIPEIPNRII